MSKPFLALVFGVLLLGLPIQSFADSKVDDALANCVSLSTATKKAACQDGLRGYIGNNAGRASNLMYKLSWAVKQGEVDEGAVVLGLKAVQESKISKGARRQAFSKALEFSNDSTMFEASFKDIPKSLFPALSTKPDGYTIQASGGRTFMIVSTFAGSTKLCRVVSLATELSLSLKTYCKLKGGNWN